MAERVMLGLGEFRFAIATLAYQKFSLNQSWRWQEQARINRDSALQFVGRNDVTLFAQLIHEIHAIQNNVFLVFLAHNTTPLT